ncbi:MAG: hypothetical protein ABIH26_04480 [Candidatus Eisenbacteria bacterium]
MIDERFLMHRLKSTSLAGIVGAVMTAVIFLYQYYARHTARWDLFAVLMTMGVVKIGSMVYYRRTG